MLEADSATPRVTLHAHADADRVVVDVSDTGPGVPSANRESVFEPLFSTRPFGIGLGLPHVRDIAERHGGGVELDAAATSGACFRVWLPLRSSSTED